MAPAKQAFLDCENAVERLLDLLGIPKRLFAVVGQLLDRDANLLANGRRERLDPVPIHLLEPPDGAQRAALAA